MSADTKRIKFNDWQTQLAYLCENMKPVDEVVAQLHIERDMYEYWRASTAVKDVSGVVLDMNEDSEPSNDFSFTFEM